MSTVYVLIDPRDGDIRYVGWTNKQLVQRLKTHLNDRDDNHRTNWFKALRDQALKPIIRVVQAIPDNLWQKAERYWIAFFRSIGCRLLNATDGGDGTPGRRPSQETRNKIRTSVQQYVMVNGVNPSFTFKGHKHTQDTLVRMSRANKGRAVSLKTRAQIALSRLGIKPTEATRAKLREAAAGRTGEKNPMFGKRHSAETREKIRIAAKKRHAR